MELRDIRPYMAQTKQTDPNNFPPYRYRPYPRMMIGDDGKPMRDKAGGYVIAKSEEEEAEIKGAVPSEPAAVEIDPAVFSQPVAAAAEVAPEPKRRGRPPKLPENLT